MHIHTLIYKQDSYIYRQAMIYAPSAPKVETKKDENDNVKPKTTKSIGGSGGFAITRDLVKSLKKAAEAPTSDLSENNVNEEPSGSNVPKEPEKPKYDWGSAPGRSMQTKSNSQLQEEQEEDIEPEIEPEYHIVKNLLEMG